MVNVPNHCWNRNYTIFIVFVDHCQMSWKKSLFLTTQILELLVNTLSADEKYLVTTRIQMELSQKQKNFLNLLLHFWNRDWIVNILKKNMILIDFVFLKLRTAKTWSDKCPKSPVSADSYTRNMVNVPKHCQNLQHGTFIIFTDRCQVNWVWKCLSYWHAKCWDCLLSHWLPMKCILFLIETI